ncbi:MAG: hypothetical protein E6713_06090 [Sporomusaceae bacterium]|nr:hypothetical protein [Sporomusaceae bacterium]
MAYGKINTLCVYASDRMDVYAIGGKIAESGEPREIAEIKDIVVGYDLLDKNGNLIARFENGTYSTWFDEPVKVND